MWNYLSSLWNFNKVNNETDLSLEDACSILEDNVGDLSKTIHEEIDNLPNKYCNRVGVITKHEDNKCFIDDIHTFNSGNIKFSIGAKVSYNILISNGIEDVINVKLIDNDWDIVETNNSLWNTRVIICKVEKQINRTLIVSPGDLIIDLNDVSMDFLPVVGDWIELDVKCLINEKVIDLSGQIIEINKVLPVRAHIETGTVTAWDGINQIGTVNRNVFFNKYSLSCGYMPLVGDKVIIEVVESDQDKCSWRALKVVPENKSKELGHLDKLNNLPEYLDEYSGLQFIIPILNFDKLNQSATFEVAISNECEENIILIDVEFLDNNSQYKVLNKFEVNVDILSNTTYNISCECTPKNVGSSSTLLLFYFKNFNIGKWLQINVAVHFEQPTSYLKLMPKVPYTQCSNNELVKGRRVSAPPRFISKQLPSYAIPKKLTNAVLKYGLKEVMLLTQELRVLKPSLFSNLTFFNFEEKFHDLLYLEEITNLIMIRNYDQEMACFIPNEDFLLLEIENLSERRPSIVLGDKVIASDPSNKNGVDFEGYVHKVGAKHIFLKFSQIFHDNYKGEDYSIKVVPSRSSYRRLHHAIFLAPRTLGKEILFPSRVHEKGIQLDFTDGNIICDEVYLNSPISNKKLSQLEVLKKLKEMNSSSNSVGNRCTEEYKLKLEWYNTKLNRIQKDAVKNVLQGKARPLPYIIFGPPGTGKTVTIIEMVLQIIRLIPQSRLLITAPSNSASDLIALRLIDSGVLKPGDLVRLVSYNYALSDNIPVKLVPYCATGNLARDGTADNEMSHSGIQYECSRASLGRHRITVTTCSLSGQLYFMGFPKGHFSHIIVDEAGQASEPEVLTPLTFLDKLSGQIILAGDPIQLGPVILCNIAAECGLSESYLERLINRFPYVVDPQGFPETSGYDPRLVTKLLHNYRSLPSILKLTSSLFYNDELIATVDDRNSDEAIFVETLSEMLPKTNLKKTPRMIFHGVNGENYQSADSPSWYNPHEAAQVFYYVNELYRLGIKSSQVGIITPYIKQVPQYGVLLSEKLPKTTLNADPASLLSNREYAAEGIRVTPVVPMKLWKIAYKGKMRCLSDPDKFVNVDFQAEWRSNLSWFLFEIDIPITILARAIAREPWTEELFKSLKEAHQTHYEQMGQLTGKLQIDDKVIALTEVDAFRDHSYGHKRDWSLMHRYIFHMFYLADKTKISIGVVCQPCTSSYLEMGFIVHPNGKLEAIDSCDLLLYQHGENGILNKELCFTFVANGTTYEVKINYEYDVVHYVGNDIEAKMNERFLVCEVNGVPGRGISEWHYNNVKHN